MSKKKKIELKKEQLLNLQEDQMKALIGAEDMSNDSGAACGNTVELALAVDKSCCRRSCNG